MLYLCLAKDSFCQAEYIKHVSKKMNNICNTQIVYELQIMLLPYELCCFTYRSSMQLESTHWVQYLVINTKGENDNTTGSNGHPHHLLHIILCVYSLTCCIDKTVNTNVCMEITKEYTV